MAGQTKSSQPDPGPAAPAEAPPGAPLALLAALGIALVLEAGLATCQARFSDTVPLLYAAKLRAAETAPPAEVLVLGDSSAVAALRPSELVAWLPEHTRVLNLALPAVGPTGGELLLERWLAQHPPPTLVLLAYTPTTLADEPASLFPTYPLAHLLSARDVLRVVERTRSPSPLLPWAASRLPSFRHRDALKEWALSRLFARAPGLRERWRAWQGYTNHPTDRHRFEWLYGDRTARNRRFLQELEAEGGWRYFKEEALRGEVLPDLALYTDPPLQPTPRELIALDRILARAEAAGSRVLVLPAPQPLGRIRAQDAEGGAQRLKAVWSELRRRHPGARFSNARVLAMPHAFFADRAHLNPAGRARYLERVGPLLGAAFEQRSAAQR